MKHEPIIFYNDRYVNTEKEAAVVSIEDRGNQFGDGIYEVIRIYNGEYHLLANHLTRLFQSLRKLDIPKRFYYDEVVLFAKELIKRNAFENKSGILYLQISRGAQPRNHVIEEGLIPTVFAYLVEKDRPLAAMKNGITTDFYEDIRWLRCDIKSLNLLGAAMAKNDSNDAGHGEALLVRAHDGRVTEGSASNFFFVKNGELYTHPADNFVLNGIVRQEVIRLAKLNGIAVNEVTFTKDEVLASDEAFFSGTTVEVLPVRAIGSHRIGNGQIGEITKKLQELFESTIVSPATQQL